MHIFWIVVIGIVAVMAAISFVIAYWPLLLGAAIVAVVWIAIWIRLVSREEKQKAEWINASAADRAEMKISKRKVRKWEREIADEKQAKEAEEKRKAEEVAIKQEHEMAICKAVEELKSKFREALSTHLLIDSNIWMSNECEVFFDVFFSICKVEGLKLIMHGHQFDEICNVKSKNDYQSERGRSARRAIGRIESFKKDKILTITEMGAISDKSAYFDFKILSLVEKCAAEGKDCSLITEDVELRVRAMQIAENINEAHLKLMEPEDFTSIIPEGLSEDVLTSLHSDQ